MKVEAITTDNLEHQQVDVPGLLNLLVTLGNTVYTLSERDGQLRVSVEGQLIAKPGGANMLLLSSER